MSMYWPTNTCSWPINFWAQNQRKPKILAKATDRSTQQQTLRGKAAKNTCLIIKQILILLFHACPKGMFQKNLLLQNVLFQKVFIPLLLMLTIPLFVVIISWVRCNERWPGLNVQMCYCHGQWLHFQCQPVGFGIVSSKMLKIVTRENKDSFKTKMLWPKLCW